ncbi:hypothetical protein LMG26411_07833 [Cupriavidus numazuensis]|uniref:Transposase n=1 Tax=Cupriavidus numazuensis TaxID=221992 RepID=A0ABM8TVY3_9BURK|nr:hypothetical protein LMG26411_07833 [Cupriavidus numazuensis]
MIQRSLGSLSISKAVLIMAICNKAWGKFPAHALRNRVILCGQELRGNWRRLDNSRQSFQRLAKA